MCACRHVGICVHVRVCLLNGARLSMHCRHKVQMQTKVSGVYPCFFWTCVILLVTPNWGTRHAFKLPLFFFCLFSSSVSFLLLSLFFFCLFSSSVSFLLLSFFFFCLFFYSVSLIVLSLFFFCLSSS